MNDDTKPIPREVKRVMLPLAPGLELETVLLDNGQTVITEESMADFLNWLESGGQTIVGK
jgi:hypothetical protein